MLWAGFAIVLMMWWLLFFSLRLAGGVIHILPVVAVAVFIVSVVSRRRGIA
jgi:hypothetical protein